MSPHSKSSVRVQDIRDILRGAIAQTRLCGCDAVILAPLIQFESNIPVHTQAEQEIFRQICARDLANALIILCRRAETMRESDSREPISKGSLALISGSLICAK